MTDQTKRLPPYLSYRTFRNFLDSVRVSGVPARIERSMMASKSGSTQALLFSAIRYFGLASEKGVSSPDLELLVHSEGKQRQEVWRRIFVRSFGPVFKSKINLERATTEELTEIFRRQGVLSKDTVRKCVTFFCMGAKDAGIKLSPHIRPYAGQRQGGRRPRSMGEAPQTQIADSVRVYGSGSNEWRLLLEKFPDFDPTWPDDVRKNWLEGFAKLSKFLSDGKSTETL
jgi:hypothetical protein